MIEQYREKGFTLIELMIVVAIIGILASIAIPQFSAYRAKAFNAAANSDLRNAMTAEEAYYSEAQEYFGITMNGGANGSKSATKGIAVSKNVTLVMATDSTYGYVGSAGHADGTKTYTVSGSVGVIR